MYWRFISTMLFILLNSVLYLAIDEYTKGKERKVETYSIGIKELEGLN
ncbi:hypothetical protein [Marinifilum sp. D737]|nr:hypothetical protein [Marinifilum sp. D737]